MKRILLVLIAILASRSLSAQTFAVPEIDYAAYNAEAMAAVGEINDKFYSPSSPYYIYYIYAAEATNVDSLLNVSSGNDLIKSIRICPPTAENPYAPIDKAIIYDADGYVMWTYDGNKANRMAQYLPDDQNLLSVVAEAGLDILFTIRYSDEQLRFGIDEGKVCVVSPTDDNYFKIQSLAEFMDGRSMAESCFSQALKYGGRDNDGNFREPVRVMPEFRGGGLELFRKWIFKRFIYPEECVKRGAEGMAIVRFTVESDGKIDNIEVLVSPHPAISKEVVRLLKRAPKWTPGTCDGEPVKVRYILPIEFKLH